MGENMKENLILSINDLNNSEIYIKIIKAIFIILITYYTNFKINNSKSQSRIKDIIMIVIEKAVWMNLI